MRAEITVVAAGDGYVLSSVEIHGHEHDAAQNFQLCTALSMHVRTVLHLIQDTADVRAQIDRPHEGSTTITDIQIPDRLQTWFSGVSALFLQGLHDLAAQFPRQTEIAGIQKLKRRDGDRRRATGSRRSASRRSER